MPYFEANPNTHSLHYLNGWNTDSTISGTLNMWSRDGDRVIQNDLAPLVKDLGYTAIPGPKFVLRQIRLLQE